MYKLKNFKYKFKNFFRNIPLFYKLLISYNWFDAYSGLETFLEIWLKDIVKRYSDSNKCWASDHLKTKESAENALGLLSAIDEDYQMKKLNFDTYKNLDMEDYKLIVEATRNARKELFNYICDNYKYWWD